MGLLQLHIEGWTGGAFGRVSITYQQGDEVAEGDADDNNSQHSLHSRLMDLHETGNENISLRRI